MTITSRFSILLPLVVWSSLENLSSDVSMPTSMSTCPVVTAAEADRRRRRRRRRSQNKSVSFAKLRNFDDAEVEVPKLRERGEIRVRRLLVTTCPPFWESLIRVGTLTMLLLYTSSASEALPYPSRHCFCILNVTLFRPI